MKIGDRVKLKEHVALMRMRRRKQQRYFSWLTRHGTIHHIRRNSAIVEVLWDGRASVDMVRARILERVAVAAAAE